MVICPETEGTMESVSQSVASVSWDIALAVDLVEIHRTQRVRDLRGRKGMIQSGL